MRDMFSTYRLQTPIRGEFFLNAGNIELMISVWDLTAIMIELKKKSSILTTLAWTKPPALIIVSLRETS
jgi:hypothetical protein